MIIHFVHIGGTVDYHYLNFLFIIVVNLIRTLWSNACYIHVYTVIDSFYEKGFPRAISHLSRFVKVTLLMSTSRHIITHRNQPHRLYNDKRAIQYKMLCVLVRR